MGRKAKRGTPDDLEPVPAVPASAEASAATAEPDSTLGSLLSTERRRPRWDDTPRLLCTGIVAGYLPGQPGEEDLEQAQPQLCPDRQSQEVRDTPELQDSPISKLQRRRYNWAAASVKGPGHYTMNPEKMQPCAKYSDSRCDICGKGERLFEFRAWERSSQEAPHLRKLHRVIAYFGKDCGRGLLGKRTSSVIDLERAKELLESSEESLREQISSLNARDRMALHRALVRISGQEEGIRNPELAQAEQSFGRLHRAEDPFRALHRILCYAISHRDLAVLVASHMKRQHRWPEMGGLLMKALQCLELQEPLPSVQRMGRLELYECLTWVTAALPCLEVELYDNGFPGAPKIFKAASQPVQEEPSSKKSRGKKKTKDKKAAAPEVYSVTLIYLSVVGELHVERSPRKPLDQRQQAAIRQAAKPLLEAALPGWSSGAVRGTSASCSGPRKVEDGWVVVPDDRQVSGEDVLSALQQITWPDCTSRRNVLQEGQTSVQAFCLGLAKAYFAPEMRLSRGTQVLPSLTKLLALFAKTIPGDPDFKYSTIQLNRNYNARLHVDKNNNGPSWIIALGEYTGGDLWIYDPHVPEKECVKVKVEMPLRGYPHLKVGQMLPGRAHSIQNRWLRFDGRCPHAALPFEGTRMSLVYFSRRGSSTILPEARHVLEGLHMPLPTEAWLAGTSDALPHSSETPCTSAEDADSSDDDEPDDYSAEANGAGLSLPRDFSEVFLHALEAAPVTDQAVIGVASLGAGIAAPMSLHPLGFKTEVTIAAEDTAIRLAKGFKVAKATKDVDSFIKGKGLCEVRHKQVEDLKPPREHIFHAVVDGAPLSLYCYNEERGFSTSKDTAAFRKIEAFLAERRPCLALIEVPDFDDVLSTLNRRAIDTCNFIRRRLGAIQGYSVEVAQVFARDFGLPLASSLLHVYAARKDVVSPARLAEVAALSRALGARLPASRAQDFLVPDEDRDLQELQRKLWARGGSAAPVASPYMDFLLKSELSKSWFFSATGDEQKLLSQAYKLALESRMDVASLLVDLSPLKRLKDSDISDNGHLPLSWRSSRVWHYAFARHRPLLGKEQLLCRGYRLQDLSPASLRSCSDQELRNFCRKAPLVPATAASLLAMLAVADMGAGTERLLQVSEATLLELIQEGRKLPPTQVQLMRNEVADPDQVAKDMRAAMCMALLGKAMPADATESPVKKGKDKKGKGADATDEDGPGVGSDDQPQQSLLGKLSTGEDVTGSWEDRARKASLWAEQLEALPFDRVMRWIAEAHEEPENAHSPRILKEGLRYLQLCMTFALGGAEHVRPLLQPGERQRERLLDKKLTRLSETLEDLLATLEQLRETTCRAAGDVSRLCMYWAIDRGRHKDARFILGGGTRPVSFFVQIMRVVARDGSAKPVSYVFEQVKNRWKDLTPEAKNDFHDADGMRVLISLLKQVNFKAKDWPTAEASLSFLLKEQEFKEVPGFLHALLVLLQKEGWRFSEVPQLPHNFLFQVVLDPLLDHIRTSNVRENGERKAIAAIHDFVDSTDPTPLEERLLATARALEQLEKTRRDLRDVQVKPTLDFLSELKETTVGEAKKILDEEQAKIDATFRAQVPGKWQDLRKFESRLLKEATGMIEEKEKSLKRSAAEAEARKQKRQRNQQLDEAKKLSDKLAKMVKKSTPEKGSTATWSLVSSSEDAADEVRAWCKAFHDKKAECDKCDAFERPDEATLEPWLREAQEAINDFQAKKLSEQLAKLLKKSNCEKGSKATWSLVPFNEDAANELREWCKAFHDKKAECGKYGPFERPYEASLEPWLKEAQEAFKDFQEHEGRLVELRRRLGLLNIPDGVIAVLKQGQRLHRLRELAQRPQLLDGIGLPPGIADRLLEGQANFVNFEPELPNGWNSKLSSSYMVHYFYRNGETDWFWPEKDRDPPARKWPAPVPGLQPAPPGSCVYVQDWSDSTKWCFLCNEEATLDHLEDRRHAASTSAWQRLSEKLDHLSDEASKVSAPRNGEELREDLILQCWMEHTLNSLEEEGVDPRIVQLFVVQCVRPHFPTSLSDGGTLAGALSSCFSEAAAKSRQPEPDVLVHPPVPVPGTDFPMVPGGMLVEIENPEEAQWIQAAKNLTEMDLLRHGLILQESGKLRCVFCETPGKPEMVENEPWAIARHLSKSRSQPGRTHQKYRQHWEGFARWLKQDGWKCKERGVSLVGRNWSCGCGKQGDVEEWLPGHFDENKHKEWEKNARRDPKATSMRPSAAVNQRLMETWTKAFEAAARKHVNRLLLNATPVGAAKKRRDPETPKGEPPAAEAQGPDAHRAAGPKRPKPEASPQTPPIGEERRTADGGGSQREPPLPELGKNFPDLSRGEFQHQGDKVFCRICEQTMRKDELETHRASRNHVKWAQSSRWAFNLLRRVGCDLWRTGKYFGEGDKAKFLICGCGKEIQWYEICSWYPDEGPTHDVTKAHLKYWQQPELSPQAWEEARLQRWRGMFRPPEPGQQEPASTQRRAAEDPAPSERPQKKLRQNGSAEDWVVVGKNREADDEEEEAPSSSSARAAYSMERAKAVPPPTAEDLGEKGQGWGPFLATRGFPEFQAPLVWGWFNHKAKHHKEAWTWCTSCGVWVASVTWSTEQDTHTLSEEGACPHWARQRHRCL